MLTSRRLQHFLAAMEQRSLLKAAESVNLSQPALSKSISVLEEEYGVKFFERHPRGLVPTAFGHAMEFHARRILLDFEQSKQDISTLASGSAGKVRIGSGLAFISYAEKAMVQLEEKYSGADFAVITDYAEGLRHALIENRIDIYVGMVNQLVEDENFETTLVAEDKILGLCHKSHPFANRHVSIDDLKNHDWVAPERSEVARTALESFFFSKQSPFPRFRVVTNNPDILGTYVRDKQMLSLSPEGSVGDFTRYDLTWFQIKDFDYVRKIGVVRRKNVIAPPLVEIYKHLLIQIIEDAFAQLSVIRD
ncbi:putative Bacterial regulatory protein, LysR [Vibrio nigripulchritudo SFn27]|uniref:Putative Bacterial regulatory protein, LysR n=1 Tax=Vibrio nigripulchritudo TaxID=28173 RepID=U4K6C6_9VIBR|nr:LysR family transcriptional regulator [Vibrio nigripulchritudo]CCN84649.1 putative Bacterial regulatory protein, LysR [Vibrio nigripulchritudo BLFn1]CCN89247.1 putative Bacterial regulatory protein, LysR [Vibrio nigripulchritudo SFn27]CCN96429.1 putative Bacterial regulatory protein, LysR [Vibrio nigripulchritudo ENn2]CCO42185.1 putative Bacterial regulatory protein, LysR [Vibrio nigripulchritudo SFn135]CCO52345.1 putative Bacterial regulatory protein, LysR [Vibrio nigripulchritudo Wn13]